MSKRRTIEDKRSKKRDQLIQRTAEALSVDEETAIALLSIGRRQAVRINTLKQSRKKTLEQIHEVLQAANIDASAIQVSPLYENGLDVAGDEAVLRVLRDSALQQEGCIYIQNAASWLPVLQLAPQPGETIVDVCAAPGGKTSLIAALTHNAAHITANDNSRPRLMRLQANMHRLGASIERFTLHDASRLTSFLDGVQFDKILLDAPCSGEGMMQLQNDKDFDSWSVPHSKRLGKLQRRLILQAWQAVKPGGSLVYSTCTIAPEENEAVIDYLLRHTEDAEVVRHDYADAARLHRVAPVRTWGGRTYDARIADSLRLAPSETAEAFYVCHLRKTDASQE